MYKKFTFILTIIVIILVVVIVALTFKLNEYKKQENNIVNLENLSEDLVTKKENTIVINSEYISDKLSTKVSHTSVILSTSNPIFLIWRIVLRINLLNI